MRLLLLFAVLLLVGCAERAAIPTPHAADVRTYQVLDLLLIPGFLLIAAGAAALVWLPEKKSGLGLLAGGGALVFSVLFYHTLLPWMPWIVGGALALGLIAGGWIAWRCILRHKALDHLANGKPLAEAPRLLRIVEESRARVSKAIAKAQDTP